MATVTLSDSQHSTLRYSQLDQTHQQLQSLAESVAGLCDMRDEDPRRAHETGDVLTGIRLLRDDLDALEALLSGGVR